MTTFSKQLLSGSTNGRPINVDAYGSSVTIHTVDSSAIDEVWLYAVNTGSSAVTLTIEFGGTDNPEDYIIATLQSQSGLSQIIPGVPLNGSVVVKAFASSANVVNIVGWVNRIS